MGFDHETIDWKIPLTSNFSVATSKDGSDWEKPPLGLVEYAGSKQNPFVDWKTVAQDGCSNVLFDSHDPESQRRYKSLYQVPHVGEDTKRTGLYVSFSSDGLRWHDYSGNPVLDTSKVDDTHTILGWDQQYNKYTAFLRPAFALAGGIRVIGRSESLDFVHWTEPAKQIILNPDGRDPEGTEFYGMAAMVYQDIYVGLLWVYHNDLHYKYKFCLPEEKLARHQQTIDVQLVTSRDGLRWERSVGLTCPPKTVPV